MSEFMSERSHKAGNLFILVGVVAWIPYFLLLAAGRTPSVLPFLAVHLVGVLTGGWLRSRGARAEPKITGPRKTIARVLVILGVLAWVPYFYLTRIQGVDQSMGPFLAAHLVGVLGGSAVRLSLEVQKLLDRGGT